MNQLGIHALVWDGRWNAETAPRAVALSAEAGFDLVEIPMLDPDAVDVVTLRSAVAQARIGVRCSLGLSFDADVTSDDAVVARRGEELLGRAVEATADIGSPLLTGVLYSALGKYASPPTQRGWDRTADALGRVADKASGAGVGLGLEVVNRYESNLLNTAASALQMIDDIGRSNVVVHLDTYHMNIEEGSFSGPVIACGDKLGYLHVGESHRGHLGSGLIDLPALFRALVQVGYEGPVTFEGFTVPHTPNDLSKTLAVWRRLWDDPMEVATGARAYLASLLVAAHGADRAGAAPAWGAG